MSSPPPANAAHSSAAPAARWGVLLGIVVFLVGVALIGYVFNEANRLFHAPPPPVSTALPATTGGAASTPDAAAASSAASGAALEIGRSLTDFVQRLLVLLVMCAAGSVIASKGVQLLFASARASAKPD